MLNFPHSLHETEINILRPFDFDEAINAWRLSHPLEDEQFDRDTILGIDAPVNEVPTGTFHFKVPIFVREVFASARDHQMWARSSRVDGLDHWKLPYHGLLSHSTLVAGLEQYYHEYQTRRDAGEHQDHFRNVLPIITMTEFISVMNFRSYVKMAEYLSLLAGRCSDILIADVLADLSAKMLSPYPTHITSKYPVPEFLNVNELYDDAQGMMRGGIYLSKMFTVPFTLRGQIARHRPLTLVDNLYAMLTGPWASLGRQDSPLQLRLAMSETIARAMVRKRNCWVAQADLWAPIVADINQALGTNIEGIPLPCSTSLRCAYVRDNELRMDGRDPAPPCPMFGRLEDRDVRPYHDAMVKYAQDRPEYEFWSHEIEKVTDDKRQGVSVTLDPGVSGARSGNDTGGT